MIILLIGGLIVFQQNFIEHRKRLLNTNPINYFVPSKVTGLVSLEFKGIVSDFLFLKLSTLLGDKIIKKEKFKQNQADFIYQAADIITDLDPWFWDAYLMADMVLAWDFKEIDLANKLLLKAKKYRTWDFKVPYYLGFNYFYFLQDNENGSKYLMEASKLPGSPEYLPALATRLSVYQNNYGPAIVFLMDLLKSTHASSSVIPLQKRLETLIILENLEKQVDKYEKLNKSLPTDLFDLVKKGFIDRIPDDPYGGKFILLPNKRVFTTSKMIDK
ncbi:MAG: hypothetical protein HOJ48_06120 [Desulfobacula sp.]|nr:hypothetical protein [Desulfobacula sp.]